MDTPDKSEQSRRANEHRLAEAFLEQAAPLLAQHPEMTPEVETQLARIAQQVGIPDDQQQIVVQLLLHQQASAASSTRSAETESAADRLPAATSATNSHPTDPQPPPLPADHQPAPPTPAPPRASPPAPTETATSSVQTAGAGPLPPATPAVHAVAHIETFLAQARQLVAQRAAGTYTRSDLEELASETGLPTATVGELLESLTGVPLESARTPAVENPPPSQESIPSNTPAEQFLERAREFCQSAGKLPRGAVRKLSRLGLKEYRLSSVYIGHLLQQVTDEMGLDNTDQQPSDNLPDDPRIRSFLKSAAPILAEYRGINTQSRLLLSAVANDHDLAEDEVELAISHLQSQPEQRAGDVTDAQLRERVESFEKHLREVLRQQPHGIITPRILRKLQDAGVQGEGLSTALAKQTIQSVAQDAGVRTITQERAVEFIDRLLDDLLEHRSRINGTMRQQLHQEGHQWGLSGDQINAVIGERLAANQVIRIRSARRTMALFSITFVLLLGICGVLVYQILQFEPLATRPDNDTKITEPGSVGAADTPTTNAAHTDPAVAEEDWRDGPLGVAISQARGIDSAWREPLDQLSAESETTRSAAYLRLISLASANVDAPTRTQLLGNVLAGCYARDPSDTSAQQLVDALLETILDPETPLDPTNQAPFDLTIWALETVTTALSRPTLSDRRSAELAEAAGERIGWLIDASLSPQELHRQCRAAVSRHFFHVLTAAAAFHPLKIHELREYAYQDARNWLDAAEIDRLDVGFLVEALRRVGDEWDVYRNAVERCVRSPDPAVVLKLLEMYQEIPNRSLVSYLTDLLLARAGKPASGAKLTPADVSERVRVSLGTDAAATPEGRWRVLWSAAASAVDRLSPSSRDADWALLDDVLQLAHLNTMACALDQKEAGIATFDQLHRAGAPPATRNLDNPGPRGRSPYVGLSGTTRSAIEITRQDRYISRALEVLSAPRLAQRQSALSQLVDLTKNGDLTGGQATKLARYLTGKGKGQAEFDYLLAALPSFRHLPYLKLALADYVAAQQEVIPQLSQVVAQLLDLEEQSGGSVETWKRDLQQQLLRHALTGNGAENRDPGTGIHDSVQESLTESYATQARLRGLAEAQYLGATSPSEVLAALVRHAAEILEPTVTGANRHFALQIDKQIDAAEYLSANDFALTVRLQRLYLRLLCIDVIRRYATLQSQANAIIQQLHQEDEKTTELVAQLRSGETALLRAWLLLAEKAE